MALINGVQFWIWPQHMIKLQDRTVLLSRREGDFLAVILSRPNRRWNANEILEYGYQDPDDEPEWGPATLRVRMCHMRRKFRRNGINLNIEGCAGRGGGYRLCGFSLVENWIAPKSPQVQRKREWAEWLARIRGGDPVYKTQVPAHGNSKLDEQTVIEIRDHIRLGTLTAEVISRITKTHKVHRQTIFNVATRRTWDHVI